MALGRVDSATENDDDDDDEEELDSETQELQRYFDYKLPAGEKKDIKESHNYLLQWWKDNKAAFPKLYRVSKAVLSIPASSSDDEGNFSDAGSKISAKRTRLLPETVDSLLMLRSNNDKFYENGNKHI